MRHSGGRELAWSPLASSALLLFVLLFSFPFASAQDDEIFVNHIGARIPPLDFKGDSSLPSLPSLYETYSSSSQSSSSSSSASTDTSSEHALPPMKDEDLPWVTVFTTLRQPTITQRASIKSFTLLRPSPEILIFADEGDEATVALAEEFGCRVIFITERSAEWGKPYIDVLFETARQQARADFVLFANADIILTQEVLAALQHTLDNIGRNADETAASFRPFFEIRPEIDYEGEWARRGAKAAAAAAADIREQESKNESENKERRSENESGVGTVVVSYEDEDNSGKIPSPSSSTDRSPSDQPPKPQPASGLLSWLPFMRPSPGHSTLPAFILGGRRWGYLRNSDEFSDQDWERMIGDGPDWVDRLKALVREKGHEGPSSAMDYFIYPRYLKLPMPRFLVGLPRWDTWILDYSIKQAIPFIETSEVAFAVHQNHPLTWSFKKDNALAMKALYPDMDHVYLYETNWFLQPCETNSGFCPLPVSLLYRETPWGVEGLSWLIVLVLACVGFVLWRFDKQFGVLSTCTRRFVSFRYPHRRKHSHLLV